MQKILHQQLNEINQTAYRESFYLYQSLQKENQPNTINVVHVKLIRRESLPQNYSYPLCLYRYNSICRQRKKNINLLIFEFKPFVSISRQLLPSQITITPVVAYINSDSAETETATATRRSFLSAHENRARCKTAIPYSVFPRKTH